MTGRWLNPFSGADALGSVEQVAAHHMAVTQLFHGRVFDHAALHFEWAAGVKAAPARHVYWGRGISPSLRMRCGFIASSSGLMTGIEESSIWV